MTPERYSSGRHVVAVTGVRENQERDVGASLEGGRLPKRVRRHVHVAIREEDWHVDDAGVVTGDTGHGRLGGREPADVHHRLRVCLEHVGSDVVEMEPRQQGTAITVEVSVRYFGG